MHAIQKILVVVFLSAFYSLVYAESSSDWDIVGVHLGDRIDKIQVKVALENKELKLKEETGRLCEGEFISNLITFGFSSSEGRGVYPFGVKKEAVSGVLDYFDKNKLIAFNRFLSFTSENETKPTVDIIQKTLLDKYGNFDAQLTFNRSVTFVWYNNVPDVYRSEAKILLIEKYTSNVLSMHGGSIRNALDVPDELEGTVLLATVGFDQNNLANSLDYRLVNFSQTKALIKGFLAMLANGEKAIIDEKLKAGSQVRTNL